MKLNKETAISEIARWTVSGQRSWTDAEIDQMCTAVCELSAFVTPHIIMDEQLGEEQIQSYLMARLNSALESWLIRAASSIRKQLRISTLKRNAQGEILVGLRSANSSELIALQSLGKKRAEELSRVIALCPELSNLEFVDDVHGFGSLLSSSLKVNAYLDQPAVSLYSPTLVKFCTRPSIESFLEVMDKTDLELFFGDGNTIARRPPVEGSTCTRLLRFVDIARTDAKKCLSPASGVLASQAARFLHRHTLRLKYLQSMQPSSGKFIPNEAFLTDTVEIIKAAKTSIDMAFFVATASAGDSKQAGSAAIIQALEERAAAGVNVRVILDRDTPGDPYRSTVINSPLVKRLRNAGIAVKQDDPSTLLHSKFLVSDKASVCVGSHNLTSTSIRDIYELSVHLNSGIVAQAFSTRFENIWQAS